MVSGRYNRKASGRSSLWRNSSESTHTSSRSTTPNSKPKHSFYVHAQDNGGDKEDSVEENASQLSKLQIESPSMSRSSKKKEWMKKRANAARSAISPLASIQNTANVAEFHQPPSKVTSAFPRNRDQDADRNIDECCSEPDSSPNNVFTFSPTSNNDKRFDSKEKPGDGIIISLEHLDIHPFDETSIVLDSTRGLPVALEESVHNLLPGAISMTTSSSVSHSCDAIKNQDNYQALNTMSSSVEEISVEETSIKEEDRNDIHTDRGDEEEYSLRDIFNSPTITLRGRTNRSSTKLCRPMPSSTSTTCQTPCEHKRRFMEETAVRTMCRSTSTCSEEARLHLLLEKVSKSSDERIMQTNWWDEESQAPSALSPRIKIHEEEEDVFATMANAVSQLLENAGCNFSLCTESDDLVGDDLVGDEIDIESGHQSMAEEDITMDLDSSLMIARTQFSDKISD